jgi:hypothetical protein
MLSRKLLESHMKESEAERIETLVATLTEALYSHDYLISRREAKSIGLPVVEPSGELEHSMVQLLGAYEVDLSLLDQFNPLFELQNSGSSSIRMAIERAYIETTASGEAFTTERTLSVLPDGTLSDLTHTLKGESRYDDTDVRVRTGDAILVWILCYTEPFFYECPSAAY